MSSEQGTPSFFGLSLLSRAFSLFLVSLLKNQVAFQVTESFSSKIRGMEKELNDLKFRKRSKNKGGGGLTPTKEEKSRLKKLQILLKVIAILMR